MKTHLLLLLAVVIFLTFGCTKSKQLTLYSSVDRSYSEQLLDGISEEVHLVGDTESAKSTGLINRLLAERNRPVADVFLSGDPMRTAFLEKKNIGKAYKDREVAARFRMVIINKEQESLKERPASILDFAKPEFAPYACLANPQFGTTSMHLAVLLDYYGEERTKQFLNNFIANGGTLVASNGEVRRRVSSGEFIYGLTDSDDVSVALSDGKPVDYLIPDQETFGGIAIPIAAVVIHNAPHPEKALALAEYLTSSQIEQVMAESLAAHFPVLTPTQQPSAFNFSYSQVKVAQLDYEKLVNALAKFQPWLDEWVASNR
jgi:iron(III) transport system substrate-binding protein